MLTLNFFPSIASEHLSPLQIPEAEKTPRPSAYSSSCSRQSLGHGDKLHLAHHNPHSLCLPPPHPPPSRCRPSLPSPLKPNRFRIPPKPPRFSRVPSISPSLKTPTVGVLSSVASTLRTLLFLLAAGLLSLSGVRPLPALASAPPPTLQPQEIEGQDDDEQQECEERKQEVEKAEVKEKEEQQEDEDDDEMRMYSAILSRSPGDVDALKCALYAKMRRADWGGALRYARRLRDAEPGEVEWRLMVAQLHELSGDLAEAERQFREVLAEDPLLLRALHVGIRLSITYMLLLI
ncbi:hypothetical protein PAHAL_3G141400 [Panicum hallii]|uniref:Uncharacterized protein n=1 Tax=Panicum hallii TaxID=206008 RepID=A0A2T8KI43_9POAL|nr:hypothetical protein PAHAL_3G141400 [Panicum hallii]